jgi:hypothetical protein
MRFVQVVQSKLRGRVFFPSLVGVLVLLFLVGWAAPSFALAALALVPGRTVNQFYLWNVATGGLLELSALKLTAGSALLLRLGARIEQLWDLPTLGTFVGATHVAAGAACFLLSLFRAMLNASSDKSSQHLFATVHFGCGGLVAAVAVAYAMEWPHTSLPRRIVALLQSAGFGAPAAAPREAGSSPSVVDGSTGAVGGGGGRRGGGEEEDDDDDVGGAATAVRGGTLTVDTAHLVSASLAVLVVLHACVGLGTATDFTFLHDTQLTVFQAAAAWVYLRFFQSHRGGYYGNDDEHFACASFFPAALRPLTVPLSAVALRVFNCYGCLTAAENGNGRALLPGAPSSSSGASASRAYRQVGRAAGSRAGSGATAEATRDTVAERRRLRALRELDAKLAALADMPDIPLKFDRGASERTTAGRRGTAHANGGGDDDGDGDDDDDDFLNSGGRLAGASSVVVAVTQAPGASSAPTHSDSATGGGGGGAAAAAAATVAAAEDGDAFDRNQRAVQAVLAAMDADSDDAGSLAASDSDEEQSTADGSFGEV